MNRPKGVTIVGILYIIMGIPAIAFSTVLLIRILRDFLAGDHSGGDPLGVVFGSTLVFFLVFLTPAVWGILSVVAGWGLLKLYRWARWMAIALAGPLVPLFPIGTLVCVLIVWALSKEENRRVFERS